ncbi:MAG: hypothetical protein FIB08_05340 [Candidatus Methanoperedens sp.]|nr:hypothetical protein [Candidatus Methanoperedens sp.]
MKSKGLISVLTFSGKSRNTLFFRIPMILSGIRDHFNISSPEIPLHIKELEPKNLIRRFPDISATKTLTQYKKSIKEGR